MTAIIELAERNINHIKCLCYLVHTIRLMQKCMVNLFKSNHFYANLMYNLHAQKKTHNL